MTSVLHSCQQHQGTDSVIPQWRAVLLWWWLDEQHLCEWSGVEVSLGVAWVVDVYCQSTLEPVIWMSEFCRV